MDFASSDRAHELKVALMAPPPRVLCDKGYMDKPYHLMTDAERIVARIASNRAMQGRVDKGQTTKSEAKDFSRLGHAFLDALPDMDKGTEAASLLGLGKMGKNRRK